MLRQLPFVRRLRMQTKIKNRDELLSHGDMESKRIVLDIAEKTLQHLDSYRRIKSMPAWKAVCL